MSYPAHFLSLLLACAAAAACAAEPIFQPPLNLPATKSPLAIRAPLNAIAPAGERLVVAGQRGHILYSSDAMAWTQAEVPLSVDLTALSFPTARQGWAVGHEGAVLHSSDGGATWQRQLDGPGIARLLQERDGAHPADKPLLDVYFEDAQHGFAVGAFNLILRTEDGGRNWTPWLDRVDNPRGLHLYAIRPAAGTLFIVGEQGLVLRLDRDTQRFVRVKLPYEGTLFGVVGTPGMVLVFGLRGNAWRSTDQGLTWTRVQTGVAAGLSSGLVRADGSVLLASQAGHVLLSRDGGASFSPIQRALAAPAFALADAGAAGIAVAGTGGVRVERAVEATRQAEARKP